MPRGSRGGRAGTPATPTGLGADAEDKLQVALSHGALGTMVMALSELESAVAPWGFDGAAVIRPIVEYNRAVTECPERLRTPRAFYLRPLNEPPHYALVVEPAITFTQGGLLFDAKARVLDGNGEPIAGLLAAGTEVGNVYKVGYAGGLALALTFAIEAVRTADWQ